MRALDGRMARRWIRLGSMQSGSYLTTDVPWWLVAACRVNTLGESNIYDRAYRGGEHERFLSWWCAQAGRVDGSVG
jgi:hypothetical protein